ncbi:MAG: type II secretion system major pseudopilin GspG [Thiobacillus sp.]|nr:type II secretion system major pseudopilin GspG [Thiobacillus sp.]
MVFQSKLARAQRGFTLLELLVVLVILGMLAALAGPRVMKYVSSAKSDTAQLQVEEFGAALDMYKLEVGRHPNTQEGLQALVEAPGGATNWNGPYLKKKTVPKDPWGADYIYASPGQHGAFDLSSLGADGREGGEGEDRDIVSW